ncbi:hypothetical protein ASG48_03465 [Aurantimonas sp. Leaf443]|nr:hypothetical protein ASG48_03465 [Aurantimonas sp. Leaf443]
MPEPAPQDAPERASDGITRRLAAAIRVLHKVEQRGDLAALRRMDPAQPLAPAFQRLLVRIAPKAGLERAKRIALLAKILALPAGAAALENGRRPLGLALAEEKIAERRVQMLMTARGEALDDAILRLARRLARRGSLPFVEIGQLLLGGEDEVEDTRYRIARAYWTSRAASEDVAPPSKTGETEE